jgi:predicted dehydrogenase
MHCNRRHFLQASGLALSAAGVHCLAPKSFAEETNDIQPLRVAVIGVRSRGVNHLEGLVDNVVAICDVDKMVLAQRAKEFEARTEREIESFSDYRRLLGRDDIDAVSIATPNHTHAMIAVAACQAGKHVYVEKPVSHNIWEGRQLVSAAERYGRVVQCGTQARSSKSIADAVEFVRSGTIGDIQSVIGTCYKPRKSIGQLKSPLEIPPHVDFDLWCGPAEKRPIYRPSLHYDWHWDFNTGNGDLGNQGIHQVDIGRWFLGEPGLPRRVISVGGRLGYEDAGDTPNSQVVLYDYERAPFVFEVRGLPKSKQDWPQWEQSMNKYRGIQIGVIVQCEHGYVTLSNDYGSVVALDHDDHKIKEWNSGMGHHYRNWLAACAAGDNSLLHAPIMEGHLSSALCHTGNISHVLGERLVKSEIVADLQTHDVGDVMLDSVDRLLHHLQRNDVNLTEQQLRLGTVLEIDGEHERFLDNDDANALLTRNYREPFVVPDLSQEVAKTSA